MAVEFCAEKGVSMSLVYCNDRLPVGVRTARKSHTGSFCSEGACASEEAVESGGGRAL